MYKQILEKLIAGNDLTIAEADEMMDYIMSGKAEPPQIAAYLTALRCKGETNDEILGSCHSIRRHCRSVSVSVTPLVDTCGTGGDNTGTFNISTVSTFVVAGAGVKVAKHGNRAVSSKAGSADLLVELGVNIRLSHQEVESRLQEKGIAFLFAPFYHPALAHAVPVRQSLGIKTIFNILGPLNNPAGVSRQLTGVFEPALTERLAGVLAALGTEHAMVVCGNPQLDEISLTGETKVSELKNGHINNYTIHPEDYGFKTVELAEIQGGDAAENARICLAVLSGEKGAARDVVLLNAGAAIYVSGVAEDLGAGIKMAVESIDSGKAKEALEKMR